MNENGKHGVYAKIAKVMERIDAIPMTGRNERFGYEYVEERMVLEKLRPIMSEVGLLCLPSQHERTVRTRETGSGTTMYTSEIRHSFRFVDPEDGSEVKVSLWGEGEDATDKGPYKALVGTLKYALLKTFMVATGDDPEHDAGHRPKSKPSTRGRDQRQSTSGAEKGELVCPDCGGPVWDNTDDEKAEINGGKRPNYKCRDEDCDWATWDRDAPVRATTSDAVPDDPGYVGPATETKRELWQYFKDEFGSDAEQKFTEFIVKCPGIPSNLDKLDAFHVEQALKLVREHGRAAMVDPKDALGEQKELV